jgi:4-nitrophenyl phosphatase
MCIGNIHRHLAVSSPGGGGFNTGDALVHVMTLRGVVLDVDGTVVRGDTPIPGAREGLDAVAGAGLRRLFVSNNPTKPPVAYEDRLARAGFDVTAGEVVTAGTVTREYLADHHRGDDIFVIGESGLVDLLTEANLSLVDDVEAADAVVVSIDRDFHYDHLSAALRGLSDESVTFVGTDPDMVIPAAERDVPGSGAVIHAVAGVTGRDPDVVLGKPSEYARDMILDRLGVPAADCLVVGDRLDTDIALGAQSGMTTALVRTGVTDDATLRETDFEPDYVLDSMAELERILETG